MRAIILAAGQGQRLRPYTDSMPKCMVPYRGKPIIDHILDALPTLGMDRTLVVGGYRQDVLLKHLAGRARLIANPDFASTNMVRSLFAAESEFGDDILICYGDVAFHPGIARSMADCPHPFATAVAMNWRELWERRMADPLSDAETLKRDEGGFVIELGKKPKSYEEIQGQYMGMTRIRGDALERARAAYHELESAQPGSTRSMYMTDFLQHLIDRGLPLFGVEATAPWIEIDAPPDLDVHVSLEP